MAFIFSFFIVMIDQASKLAAVKYLKEHKPYIVVSNFFELNYVENVGAAFGILKNRRILFIIITISVILILTAYIYKNYNSLNKWSVFAFSMLIGGAMGNAIDRIRYGYVIDFLSFRLFNMYDFPVFNIADISIVMSTLLIAILVLFEKIEI